MRVWLLVSVRFWSWVVVCRVVFGWCVRGCLGNYLLICFVSFVMPKVLMVLYLGSILRLARVEHGLQEVRNLQPVLFNPHSHNRCPPLRSRSRGTIFTSETNLIVYPGLRDPCICLTQMLCYLQLTNFCVYYGPRVVLSALLKKWVPALHKPALLCPDYT